MYQKETPDIPVKTGVSFVFTGFLSVMEPLKGVNGDVEK